MDAVINQQMLHILPDSVSLFQAATKDFIEQVGNTLHKQPFFTVVLSGGDTPKLFFDTLVSHVPADFSWQRIKFFFGDERYVAANDQASNYHMAYEHLFSKVSVPSENIYRIPTELSDPKLAAEQYEYTVRAALEISVKELPLFDLVYLGLGGDAHTASLMPGTEVVKASIDSGDNMAGVVALWVPERKMYRITLTPVWLNNSVRIRFLTKGEDKALAVWQVLQGPHDPLQVPAQLIRCAQGETDWYLDQPAAQRLKF